MGWPYRHIIVVSAADQIAANSIAAQIDPDDGSRTFTVPLSPNGLEPATHFACSTLSDQAMAELMFAVDASDPPILSSVVWWRLDSATEHLIDSNSEHGTSGASWSWSEAITALSLTRVVPEGEE